jgi:NADH-quinone oxidoreductase subunit G
LEIADRTLAIIEQHGPEQIAALASPNSTLEEFYLLQKWLRAFGSNHIDHRVRQQDFDDQDQAPLFPHLDIGIDAVEGCQSILLVGSNIRYEQPLLGLRINKAVQDGAQVMSINPKDYHFNFNVIEKLISVDIVGCLAEVAAALNNQNKHTGSNSHWSRFTPRPQALTIAENLKKTGKKAVILLGEYALSHPQASLLRALVRYICEQTSAASGIMTEGANSAGAWLAGAVPHRGPNGIKISKPGEDAYRLLTSAGKKAYFLLGLEPEMDCIAPAQALQNLKQASLVVCLTPFITSDMEEYADFILPITPHTENAGTYVNINGVSQFSPAVTIPSPEVKPAWKIIRVLANFMELPGFDYEDIHQLQKEMNEVLPPKPIAINPSSSSLPEISVWEDGRLIRLAPWLLYRSDPLVRRSIPLQETMQESHLNSIAIHSVSASRFGLKAGQRVTACQGDSRVTFPLRIDDRLAPGVVFIPSALPLTTGFGQASVEISLQAENE